MTGTAAVVSRDKGQDSTFNKQARDRGQTNYTYDVLGQLKTAMGKESGGPSRLHEQFKYGYDYARNLSFRTNNALVQSFTNNNLNQLSTVGRSGTLTVAGTTTTNATSVTVNSLSATRYADATFAKDGFSLADGNNTFTAIAQDAVGRSDTNAVTINLPASPSYSYDSNGNLLADGRRTFTYDDENQLNSIIVTNAGGSSTLTTNIYDGLFRRRIRKEFSWVNGTWAPAGEVRYVYDRRLVVQERDGNNVALISYTRGTDLSGTREGAGGIGGLLARTDHGQLTTGNGQPHAFYHADGNGNVTALVNDKQLIVARYTYDPFGSILAKSGPLADANTYRLSSQEYHQPSGLSLYLYRAYDPNLQRFINRDPIEEEGGINLYAYVFNDPINEWDDFGLDGVGHHYCPSPVRRDPLWTDQGRAYIEASTSGAYPEAKGAHNFSNGHYDYNEAVKELWEKYKKEKEFDNKSNRPCAGSAEDFIEKRIKKSKDPRINNFLKYVEQQTGRSRFDGPRLAIARQAQFRAFMEEQEMRSRRRGLN